MGGGIPEFGPDQGTGKGDLGRERGIVGEIQTQKKQISFQQSRFQPISRVQKRKRGGEKKKRKKTRSKSYKVNYKKFNDDSGGREGVAQKR